MEPTKSVGRVSTSFLGILAYMTNAGLIMVFGFDSVNYERLKARDYVPRPPRKGPRKARSRSPGLGQDYDPDSRVTRSPPRTSRMRSAAHRGSASGRSASVSGAYLLESCLGPQSLMHSPHRHAAADRLPGRQPSNSVVGDNPARDRSLSAIRDNPDAVGLGPHLLRADEDKRLDNEAPTRSCSTFHGPQIQLTRTEALATSVYMSTEMAGDLACWGHCDSFSYMPPQMMVSTPEFYSWLSLVYWDSLQPPGAAGAPQLHQHRQHEAAPPPPPPPPPPPSMTGGTKRRLRRHRRYHRHPR